MGNTRRAERLRKLLEDADVAKIKSYIKKHCLKLNRIIVEKTAETFLHLAVKKGRDDVVQYLLKKGADASISDGRGDTPLHIAAKRALAGEKYAFQDLVLPLMHKCPEALGVRNKAGVTARSLVNTYEESLKASTHYDVDSSPGSDDVESTNMNSWYQKLADEVDQEYGAWATYEQDYYQDRDEETYEDWVERIRSERRTKHYQNVASSSGVSRRRKEEEEKAREFQHKLEKDHEMYQERIKMRMKERKQKEIILKKTSYEQKWTELFASLKDGLCLSFSDIPWPVCVDKSPDTMKDFFFCDFDVEETDLRKRYLRSQQVRWHPDKFSQKFGQLLLDSDRDRILEEVKNISQVINQLSEQLAK